MLPFPSTFIDRETRYRHTFFFNQVYPLEVKWACRDNLYAGYTAEQRQSRLTNATSFLMTASCPSSAPRHLADACRDQSKYLPVSVHDNGGQRDVTVFANKFCAQCHGAEASSAVPWKVSMRTGYKFVKVRRVCVKI